MFDIQFSDFADDEHGVLVPDSESKEEVDPMKAAM